MEDTLIIVYKARFIRKYKKLPEALKEETRDKISLFSKHQDHMSLKAHKLKGKLKGFYSFSVNYKYRIVYHYEEKNKVALDNIGDHSIYN